MIYFAQLPNGAVKIGCTTNLNRRKLRLRVELGCEIDILATIEGDKQQERELHDRFFHLRLGTSEQFRPGDDLMDFIHHPRCRVWRDVEQMPIRHMGTKPSQFRFTDTDKAMLKMVQETHGLDSLTAAVRFLGQFWLMEEHERASKESEENSG